MTSTRAIAGTSDLGDDVLHVPRGQELPLLDVDDGTGLRRGDQKIRLSAEEGRDLQDIDRFGDRLALVDRRGCPSASGRPSFSRISAKTGSDFWSPIPRAPVAEVRFALSKEVL